MCISAVVQRLVTYPEGVFSTVSASSSFFLSSGMPVGVVSRSRNPSLKTNILT